MRWSVVLCLVACAGRAPAPAAAYKPPVSCAAPEYHALDFWLGEWEVTADGKVDGHNIISPILGGCAVREAWTDVDGHKGESLFFYDRSLARWKQVWVTTEGTWKEKTQIDAPEPGALRFQGLVPRMRGGVVLDRTTLSRLPDGRVRQRIEVSRDDGATWEAWEGLYARAAPACDGAPRDLDFWVGEWDLVVRARTAPDRDEWDVAHGTNRIARVLGGCSIEESFTADGPDKPWAGKSLSIWVPADKRWRQTWVDDGGDYLTFAGGMDGKDMVLVGEPKVVGGKTRQMRMVFTDITPATLLWRWEGTTDGGKSWTPMLVIEYRRRG